MKLIGVLVIVSALVAVALAVPHHKEGHIGTSCDYHCETEKDLEKPLSASNGTCIRNFPNECELELYNCEKHPEKQFEVQDDQKAADKPLPLCPVDEKL